MRIMTVITIDQDSLHRVGRAGTAKNRSNVCLRYEGTPRLEAPHLERLWEGRCFWPRSFGYFSINGKSNKGHHPRGVLNHPNMTLISPLLFNTVRAKMMTPISARKNNIVEYKRTTKMLRQAVFTML